MKIEAIRQRWKAGDRLILPRFLSRIENDPSFREQLLRKILGEVGRAHRVGITGPPGAGKSTLTNLLALTMAEEGKTVGVLAVDPSSPFSGGALLGDRIRMTEASMHPRVYIRSMATRGSLGGLARSTVIAADFLDVMGFDVILIETVGVGQIELDILEASDTVVVVLVPESGDSVQAMKAGLMEIADILVVNKADRDGARRLIREIETTLRLAPGRNPAHHFDIETHQHHGEQGAFVSSPEEHQESWEIPVLATVALRGEGLEDLHRAILRHQAFLDQTGVRESRRKERIWATFRHVIQEHLWEDFLKRVGGEESLKDTLFQALKNQTLHHFLEEHIWKPAS